MAFKMRKNYLPTPKKILKRGLYEAMWGAKPRDYDKVLTKKSEKTDD